MRQDHRVVGEKGFFLLRGYEIDQVIRGNVRTKSPLLELLVFIVNPHQRPAISLPLKINLPKACIFKTCVEGHGTLLSKLIRVVFRSKELPLADDGGRIARVFEVLSDRFLISVEH